MGDIDDFDMKRFSGQKKEDRRDLPEMDGDGVSRERYIALGKKQYFDTQRREVVEKIGDTLKVVAEDRRRLKRPVPLERRKNPDSGSFNWIPLGNNLFFDRTTRVIMKKTGTRMVLYTRDRRKSTRERRAPRPDTMERRKRR